MSQQFFYIKFIIQLTFISNGFWLIDLIHRLNVWICTWLHNQRQKDSVIKTLYKDNYQFDLGYHQSYSLVVFLNCVLFSALVPIIPMFAWLFFSVKY